MENVLPKYNGSVIFCDTSGNLTSNNNIIEQLDNASAFLWDPCNKIQGISKYCEPGEVVYNVTDTVDLLKYVHVNSKGFVRNASQGSRSKSELKKKKKKYNSKNIAYNDNLEKTKNKKKTNKIIDIFHRSRSLSKSKNSDVYSRVRDKSLRINTLPKDPDIYNYNRVTTNLPSSYFINKTSNKELGEYQNLSTIDNIQTNVECKPTVINSKTEKNDDIKQASTYKIISMSDEDKLKIDPSLILSPRSETHSLNKSTKTTTSPENKNNFYNKNISYNVKNNFLNHNQYYDKPNNKDDIRMNICTETLMNSNKETSITREDLLITPCKITNDICGTNIDSSVLLKKSITKSLKTSYEFDSEKVSNLSLNDIKKKEVSTCLDKSKFDIVTLGNKLKDQIISPTQERNIYKEQSRQSKSLQKDSCSKIIQIEPRVCSLNNTTNRLSSLFYNKDKNQNKRSISHKIISEEENIICKEKLVTPSLEKYIDINKKICSNPFSLFYTPSTNSKKKFKNGCEQMRSFTIYTKNNQDDLFLDSSSYKNITSSSKNNLRYSMVNISDNSNKKSKIKSNKCSMNLANLNNKKDIVFNYKDNLNDAEFSKIPDRTNLIYSVDKYRTPHSLYSSTKVNSCLSSVEYSLKTSNLEVERIFDTESLIKLLKTDSTISLVLSITIQIMVICRAILSYALSNLELNLKQENYRYNSNQSKKMLLDSDNSNNKILSKSDFYLNKSDELTILSLLNNILVCKEASLNDIYQNIYKRSFGSWIKWLFEVIICFSNSYEMTLYKKNYLSFLVIVPLNISYTILDILQYSIEQTEYHTHKKVKSLGDYVTKLILFIPIVPRMLSQEIEMELAKLIEMPNHSNIKESEIWILLIINNLFKLLDQQYKIFEQNLFLPFQFSIILLGYLLDLIIYFGYLQIQLIVKLFEYFLWICGHGLPYSIKKLIYHLLVFLINGLEYYINKTIIIGKN